MQNRGIIMNIIMWIVIILGGILGIAVTLGTVAGMVGVIIYKICRKIRYGISLYNWCVLHGLCKLILFAYNDFTYYSVSYIRKKCRNIFIY